MKFLLIKIISVYLLCGLLLINCSTDSEESTREWKLTFISSHDLDIEDPSGLTIDASGDFLWTVSDSNGGHIYKISFNGQILDILPYEGNDMEGITMDPRDETLWIAEERLRTILQLDTDGNVLQEINVPVTETNTNDGLEGIAVNHNNGHIYVVNEKEPMVFIEFNEEMDVVRNLNVAFEMPYTVSSLSGLFYDAADQQLWILSDESEKIIVTDLNLNPRHYLDLDRIKFEGIALDLSTNVLYLVNDEEDKLYVYQLE